MKVIKKYKCILCKRETDFIISRELREKEKANVYYCRKCKLGMLDNSRLDLDLKLFYKNNYRKKFKPVLNKRSNPETLFNIYSRFQRDRIRLLSPYLSKKMSLLEVGCSSGMFLYHIKKYVKNIFGIDYDINAAKFTSKKCSCPVFVEDIENTGLKKESLEAICMFQSLEHFRNPYESIMNLRQYLKKGGIIHIEVPNLCDSLIYAYNLSNHYKFYFHRAHLWYFTENSLKILMKKAGFKGKIYFTQDYNILNHMHWLSVDAPQNDCLQGLSSPILPLRKNLEINKAKELGNWINKIDSDYKKLLSRLKITSNIHFIGKKT